MRELLFFKKGGQMIKTRIFRIKIGFLEFMEAWCVKKARKVRKKYYKWSVKASGGEKGGGQNGYNKSRTNKECSLNEVPRMR